MSTGTCSRFVMKMESVTFPEAVRAVATKMGIALPKREFNSPEEAREAGLRRQLMDIHEAATQYFEQSLKSPEAARAREYLTGRGMTRGDDCEVSHRVCAGELQRHARPAGEVLSRRGVAGERAVQLRRSRRTAAPGPMYARFRKRITFPIANEQGKPIAFTARALDTTSRMRRRGRSI